MRSKQSDLAARITGGIGLGLGLWLALACGPGPTLAGVTLAVLPDTTVVQAGAVFDVELTVTEAGSPFNGFDAYVGYDPAVLTFIQLPDSVSQGPLMKEACANPPFHLFQIAPDSTSLSINYFLLCAGVSVTGPGVVYRLRFQAAADAGWTSISLLPGTTFYDAGVIVTPLATTDADVYVGTGTGVPDGPTRPNLNLRAAPNPFNPATTVFFDVPRAGRTSLAVYGLDGRRVLTLLDAVLPAGSHQVRWRGRDAAGQRVSSGVYNVCLEIAGRREVRPVTLLK